MKYKILINCKNPAMLMDFFQRTDSFFKSLSTSDCWQDVFGHFETFSPDAYVCFVDSIYNKILTQTQTLKNSEFYNGAPVIIVADAETCNTIELQYLSNIDLIIRRPISLDNLTLRIIRYFEEANAEKAAKQAAVEAKAAEASAAEQAGGADAVTAAAADSGEKKHILVIDDDRTVLKMLKTVLQEQYDVTILPNGLAMDRCLESKRVDLILLDYEMPLETGADLFKKLKQNPKAADIPVCFLTGVSDREKTMEIMALKPHGYLLKPIDVNMLLSTISNLIG